VAFAVRAENLMFLALTVTSPVFAFAFTLFASTTGNPLSYGFRVADPYVFNLTPSNPFDPHRKILFQILSGGGRGYRTPVRSAFQT
jgi:hypothetical protein